MNKIRIVHIINSFEYGGAEAMLCNLLLRTDTERFEPHVVSLIDDLTVAAPIIGAGIPLTVIGMRPGVPDPRAVVRLVRHLRRLRPDVVQTWMDHSNLIGGVAARMSGVGARVVWGVHHSNHIAGVAKRSTLITVGACAKLSRRVPAGIVVCSQNAAGLYAQRGFDAQRMTVIPNGFDTAGVFRVSGRARQALRASLGWGDDVPVIGLAARYDPMKDHGTFLRAASLLAATHPRVRFLLCGHQVDEGNAELMTRIRSLGVEAACRLLGPRRDMPDVYPALDVATSSSISEAFPLVLGEAMACGVPCVATDVGDSKLIVGDAGRIVPPSDPAALAAAWRELLAMPTAAWRQMKIDARQRIVQMFDLASVTRRYEQLYLGLCAGGSAAAAAAAAHDTAAPEAEAAVASGGVG